LIVIFDLKEVWPDDSIFTYGAQHSHFLLSKWAMGVLMGLSLKPVTHILLIDVPAQVAVSLITEESQIQLARAIFNPLTNILTKRMSFCYIVISSPLQDFNFVRKKLKVFMANSEKL